MSSSTPPPSPASSITLVLALFLAPTVRAGIVTEYLVDTTVDSLALDQCNDSVPADCSLRAAVQLADNDGGDSRIFLGNGVHRLTIAGAEEDANATGDLDLRNATGVFEILNIPGTHPVIEQATVPRRPTSPNRKKIATAGVAGGVLVDDRGFEERFLGGGGGDDRE